MSSANLDGYRVRAEEFRELDQERVLVLVEQSARGKASGIAVSVNGANVFQIRDGQVVRLVLYADRERAFADLQPTPGAGA